MSFTVRDKRGWIKWTFYPAETGFISMEDRPGGGVWGKFGRIAQTYFNHIRLWQNIEILLILLHFCEKSIGLIFRMPSTNKSQSRTLLHSCSLPRRSSLLLLLFLYLAGDEISAYQSHSLSQTHQSVQSQCGGVPATATLASNYSEKWMKSGSWISTICFMNKIWIWQIYKKFQAVFSQNWCYLHYHQEYPKNLSSQIIFLLQFKAQKKEFSGSGSGSNGPARGAIYSQWP